MGHHADPRRLGYEELAQAQGLQSGIDCDAVTRPNETPLDA